MPSEKFSVEVFLKAIDQGFSKAISGAKAALGTIGDAAKVAGIGVAGFTAVAGAGAIALSKEVISSFGELEQNLGGSEAVFGDYASAVQKLGEDAYKALGTSQSDYLATANVMGALFQGSGVTQQKSLDLTTKAMQRAADMASVMGIDTKVALDSVAGAAKGNFTMMDNLGVAMNATTIEAYALEKGVNFKWATASQAEKSQIAMEMFFDKTSQYAGNFEREAEQTISGSIGMLTASVSSFVAGLGNANADMATLSQNVVNSLGAVVANVVPIINNLVASLPTALQVVLSEVIGMLPSLMKTVSGVFSEVLQMLVALLPELIPVVLGGLLMVVETVIANLPLIIEAGLQILSALSLGILQAIPTLIPLAITAIQTIVQSLSTQLPLMMASGKPVIDQLLAGILQAIPTLIPLAITTIQTIVQSLSTQLPLMVASGKSVIDKLLAGIGGKLPEVLAKGSEMLMKLISGILDKRTELLRSANTLIQDFGTRVQENLPSILEKGKEMLSKLVSGILSRLPELLSSAMSLITSFAGVLLQNLPTVMAAGVDMLLELVNGILASLPELVYAAAAALGEYINEVASNFPAILEKGFELIIKLGDGILKAIPALLGLIPVIFKGLKDSFAKQDWGKIGGDIVRGLWNGISNLASWILGKIGGFVNNVLGGIKKFFGINSPSKETTWMGEMLDRGLIVGMEDELSRVDKMSQKLTDAALPDLEGELGRVSFGKAPEMGLNLSAANEDPEGMSASINLNLGRQRFKAFVKDITKVQDEELELQGAF